MKRFLIVCFACLMTVMPVLAEENTPAGSWSQINQAVSKGTDWIKVSTDGTFHLGGKTPLEGYDGLYIGDWGTWPSMDGSTVCVPMAMELARQWLELEEGDLNGFVNFSTTPYAYDRLTQGKANPLVTIKSRGIMMDDTHPIDLVLATYPNADERQAAADAGVELVYVPFCYDAFVFMVNAANPVDSLTQQQLKDIYSGKITNWAQVGGISWWRPARKSARAARGSSSVSFNRVGVRFISRRFSAASITGSITPPSRSPASDSAST